MTEKEWLVSTDPQAMMEFLRGPISEQDYPALHHFPRPSDRKLRLFAKEAGCRKCDDFSPSDPPAYRAVLVAGASCRTRAEKVAILRDIFGNPFRPLVYVWNGRYEYQDQPGAIAFDKRWLRWHDGFIPTMAQIIYDERSFGEMSILADALEEAGCTDEEILRHCRKEIWCLKCRKHFDEECDLAGHPVGVRPHVRGCWVLDLLLGKE